MADPAECRHLAARLEAGETGTPIDREVLLALGHLAICDDPGEWHGRLYRLDPNGGRSFGGCGDDVLIDAVSTSLDAAHALQERHFPELGWIIGKGRTRPAEPMYGAQTAAIDDPTELLTGAEADTHPAAAWTAAILRTVADRG